MYPHLSGIFLTFTSVHVSAKCRRLQSHEASATCPRQLLFLPHRKQQHRVVRLADIHFRYSKANPVTVSAGVFAKSRQEGVVRVSLNVR